MNQEHDKGLRAIHGKYYSSVPFDTFKNKVLSDEGRFNKYLERLQQDFYPNIKAEEFADKYYKKYGNPFADVPVNDVAQEVERETSLVSQPIVTPDVQKDVIKNAEREAKKKEAQQSAFNSLIGIDLDQDPRQRIPKQQISDADRLTPMEMINPKESPEQLSKNRFMLESESLLTHQKALSAAQEELYNAIQTDFGDELVFEKYQESNSIIQRLNNEELSATEIKDLTEKLNNNLPYIEKLEGDARFKNLQKLSAAHQKNSQRIRQFIESNKTEYARNIIEKIEQKRKDAYEGETGFLEETGKTLLRSLAKIPVTLAATTKIIAKGASPLPTVPWSKDPIYEFAQDLSDDINYMYARNNKYDKGVVSDSAKKVINGITYEATKSEGPDGEEELVVRDNKGFIIEDEAIKEQFKDATFETNFNKAEAAYKTGEVLADLAIQVALTRGMGGALNAGGRLLGTELSKKAVTYASSTAVTAGTMYPSFYKEGLEQFEGDKTKAHRYATGVSVAIGLAGQLFGLETKLSSGVKGILEKAKKAMPDELAAAITAKGINIVQAAGIRAGAVIKDATGEVVEEAVLEPAIQAGYNYMYNSLSGTKFDTEVFGDTKDVIETATLSFAAGTVGGAFASGQAIDETKKQAVYTMLQNPDKYRDLLDGFIKDGSLALDVPENATLAQREDAAAKYITEEHKALSRAKKAYDVLKEDLTGEKEDLAYLLYAKERLSMKIDALKDIGGGLTEKLEQNLKDINSQIQSITNVNPNPSEQISTPQPPAEPINGAAELNPEETPALSAPEEAPTPDEAPALPAPEPVMTEEEEVISQFEQGNIRPKVEKGNLVLETVDMFGESTSVSIPLSKEQKKSLKELRKKKKDLLLKFGGLTAENRKKVIEIDNQIDAINKDIVSTYKQSIAPPVTSVTPETVAPETVTPETVTPETVTPETVTPETVAPEAVAPETVTPETVAPETVVEPATTEQKVDFLDNNTGKQVSVNGYEGTLNKINENRYEVEKGDQIFEFTVDQMNTFENIEPEPTPEPGKQYTVSNIQESPEGVTTANVNGVDYIVNTNNIGNVESVSPTNKPEQRITNERLLTAVEIERNKQDVNDVQENEQILNEVRNNYPNLDKALNTIWNVNYTESIDNALEKLYNGEKLTPQEELSVSLWLSDAFDRISNLFKPENTQQENETILEAYNTAEIINNLLYNINNKTLNKDGKPRKKATNARQVKGLVDSKKPKKTVEAESKKQPTAEPTAEPVTEPTAEPVTEPTAEPVTEPTAEPTAEPVTEQATEQVTEQEPVEKIVQVKQVKKVRKSRNKKEPVEETLKKEKADAASTIEMVKAVEADSNLEYDDVELSILNTLLQRFTNDNGDVDIDAITEWLDEAIINNWENESDSLVALINDNEFIKTQLIKYGADQFISSTGTGQAKTGGKKESYAERKRKAANSRRPVVAEGIRDLYNVFRQQYKQSRVEALYSAILADKVFGAIAKRKGISKAEAYKTVGWTDNAMLFGNSSTIKNVRGAALILEDGTAVIGALTDPNVSTPMHELAHVFEHYLTDAERSDVLAWAGETKWTTAVSEKFATGFEKYLSTGKAPNDKLKAVFNAFKKWLSDIYNGVKGSEIDIELNDKMFSIYNKIIGEDVEGTPAQEIQRDGKVLFQAIRRNGAWTNMLTGISGWVNNLNAQQSNTLGFRPKTGWLGKKLPKWFKAGGKLPGDTFFFDVERKARVQAIMKRVDFTVRDLKSEVKKSFGKPFDKLTEAERVQLNDVLSGNPNARVGLSNSVLNILDNMRLQIDQMSIELVRAGLVPEKMVGTFIDNLQFYVHRSYRIFKEGEDWIEKVQNTRKFSNAIAYITSELNTKKQKKLQYLQNAIRRAADIANAAPPGFPTTLLNALNDFEAQLLNVANMQAMVASHSSPFTNAIYRQGIADLSNSYSKFQQELRDKKAYFTGKKKKPTDPNFNFEYEFMRVANRISSLQKDIDKIDETLIDVPAYTLQILQKYAGNENIYNSKLLSSVDKSIFKKRKDVPEPIRELMGEYKEADVNFAETMYRMISSLENARFNDTIKDKGINNFLFETPRGEFNTKIKLEGDRLSPIPNELYTTKEIAESFNEGNKIKERGEFYQIAVFASMLGKVGNTIISHMTQFRNFFFNFYFQFRSGNFVGAFKHFGKATAIISTDSKYASKFYSNDNKRAEIEKLTRLGIVYDNFTSGVLNDIAKENANSFAGKAMDWWDVFVENIINSGNVGKTIMTPVKKLINFVTKDLWNVANELYAAGDNWHKIVRFYTEQRNYAEAIYNDSYENLTPQEQAEIDNMARDIVVQTMPTYSFVPPNFKEIGKMPAIGTFVSFPIESIRVERANALLIKQEMANPLTRKLARKRAIGTFYNYALTNGSRISVANLVLHALGYDREDEDLLRYFYPPWTQNSPASPVTHIDKLGNFYYIDFSDHFPNGYVMSMINGMFDSRDSLAKNFLDVLQEAYNPFFSADIVIGRVAEVFRGTTFDGTPIKNLRGGLDVALKGPNKQEAIIAAVKHIYRGMEFGSIRSIRKTVEAWSEYGKGSAEKNPYLESLANVGVRVSRTNIYKSFTYKLKDVDRQINDIRSIYIDVQKEKAKLYMRKNNTGGYVTPTKAEIDNADLELFIARERTKAKYINQLDKAKKIFKAVEKMRVKSGGDVSNVLIAFKDANINNEEKEYIIGLRDTPPDLNFKSWTNRLPDDIKNYFKNNPN